MSALNEDQGNALRARAGAVVNHDELLKGRPEVAEDTHIGHLIATTAEYSQIKPLIARVWVPGFRDPATGKLGMVATVRKPSPDNEIRIYSKSRETHIPEEASKWLLPDHIPATGRSYRWDTIWKLVYCCVAPVATFDWAVKIMSLSHGSDVVKPLIDKIDELMATPAPIDSLTGGNIFAYPTLLGGAKTAARDGKLTEYLGSLEKGVAQTILDNARTMLLIQMQVMREDAELKAVVNHVVNYEIKKGEYEPSPTVADALQDPWGEYMALLQRRASGVALSEADASAATPYRVPEDDLPPAPQDDGPLADVRAFAREVRGEVVDVTSQGGTPYWAVRVPSSLSPAYHTQKAASFGLDAAFFQMNDAGLIYLRPVTNADEAHLNKDDDGQSARATIHAV